VNIVKLWKMTLLGCNFNINFDQILAPGSSLCNTLRTKLHAWTESPIIVEFMVKFIWQHNLPVGSYHTFKMPPGRLDFWCWKGKKWDPPPCNSKTKSRRSEPKWHLKYLITLLCQVSAKSVDHNFWPLEHFLRQYSTKVGWHSLLKCTCIGHSVNSLLTVARSYGHLLLTPAAFIHFTVPVRSIR